MKENISESAIRAVFEKSLRLKPGETCLIITDTKKKDIAEQFYNWSKNFAAKVHMEIVKPGAEHGVEPPGYIARLMLEYDVQLLITSKSLSHTDARRNATKNGARIASMPGITTEIANRCLDIDYDLLKHSCTRLYNLISKAERIELKTGKGTDFTAVRGNRKVFGKHGGSFGYRGAFGNLPEGEISFCPVDSFGVYVVDVSFPGLGRLKSPIIFKVKNSKVYEIKGIYSEKIIRRLNGIGSEAFIIAEVGIGTHPKAITTGNVLEDEKVLGTAHIALGNNVSYGGNNNVPLHLDGVIQDVSIYVDGKVVMEKGKAFW